MRTYSKTPLIIRGKRFVLEYSEDLNLQNLITFLTSSFKINTKRGGWNYIAVTKVLANGATHTLVYCSFNYVPYIYSTKTVYRADGIEATPRVCVWDDLYLLRVVLTSAGPIDTGDIYTSFDDEFIEKHSFVLKNTPKTEPTNEELRDVFHHIIVFHHVIGKKKK
jgi:hypothetical protein